MDSIYSKKDDLWLFGLLAYIYGKNMAFLAETLKSTLFTHENGLFMALFGPLKWHFIENIDENRRKYGKIMAKYPKPPKIPTIPP
jgi:hypothetical protein